VFRLADEVREFFGLRDELCDFLFVDAGTPKRAILVELKGGHLGHARKQLGNPLANVAFRECVETSLHLEGAQWFGVVVLGSGGAPSARDRVSEEFERKHRATLYVVTGDSCDLRDVLTRRPRRR
jgi:hypothetical protein